MSEYPVPAICHEREMCYLTVDGAPVFLRAGEIHNSSASTKEYMETEVWPYVEQMNLDALLVPVYWECIEPTEGNYEFSLVDSLLLQARKANMRLILLWFGLWKNGNSDYAPGWVKRDSTRFWQIADRNGCPLQFRGKNNLTISPICEAAVDADARCFSALMAHLRQQDSEKHTVVMVQVENEIGVLGSDRDYSLPAQKAFSKQVPETLQINLNLAGSTWQACFGNDAAEKFMAWHYACSVEKIAAAGKIEYPLPMYCNAWLRQVPRVAGEYPSGGPQLHNQEIWKIAAPSIDFFAPDIYLKEYRQICDAYCEAGNLLCIPEVRRTADAVPYYFYALGEHGTACFSPFGVEDMLRQDTRLDAQTLRLLDISEDAMVSGPNAGQLLSEAYRLTKGMGAVLSSAIIDRRTHGFLDGGELGANIVLRGCILRVEYDKGIREGDPLPGGMVVELSTDEFIVLGVHCKINVAGRDSSRVEVERYEEGWYENGSWVCRRILNGDERSNVCCHETPRMILCKIFQI